MAVLLLLLVMLHEIVRRYGFGAPTVWGSELATMLNAAVFLLGAAVTLQRGGHVSIDVLAERLPTTFRRLAMAVAYLGLLAPVLGGMAALAWRRALADWRSGEVDLAMAWQVPSWPMQALVALCLTLLLLQLLAEAARQLAAARAGAPPAVVPPPAI